MGRLPRFSQIPQEMILAVSIFLPLYLKLAPIFNLKIIQHPKKIQIMIKTNHSKIHKDNYINAKVKIL